MIKIQKTRTRAFTIVEVLVVAAIIGVLAVLGGVFWLSRVESEKGTQCNANLLRLEDAFSKYRLVPDNRTSDPASITLDDIKSMLPDAILPVCPTGGSYTLNATGRVTCSKDDGTANANHDDGRN